MVPISMVSNEGQKEDSRNSLGGRKNGPVTYATVSTTKGKQSSTRPTLPVAKMLPITLPSIASRFLIEVGIPPNNSNQNFDHVFLAMEYCQDHVLKTLLELGAQKVDPLKSMHAEDLRLGTGDDRISKTRL
jgi:hypothetical protein